MAYDTKEISPYAGHDIRLYEFKLGSAAWRYCNGDRDTIYAGEDAAGHLFRYDYLAAPVSDDGLKQKGTATADDFIVNLPTTYPLPLLFRGTPPSGLIRFTLRMQQYGELTEAPIMWRGYVASCKIKDEVMSQVICNTQVAFMHRAGLRAGYTRECNHALYDVECRVKKSEWAEPVIITACDGVSVQYSYVNTPLSDNRVGRFTNGFMEWEPTVNGVKLGYVERRAIQFHVGVPDPEAINLLGQTDGLTAGMAVTLYPGCDRSPGNCQLFNNIPNYGGYAMMTGRSPFDGNPVW